MCSHCKYDAAWRELQRAGRRLQAVFAKHNFDPDQPRVPAGNTDGGQWIDEGAFGNRSHVAVSREERQRCFNDCYYLLERFKVNPGEDYNEFDFRKCIRSCLDQLV